MLAKLRQAAAKDLTFIGAADLRYSILCKCVSFVLLLSCQLPYRRLPLHSATIRVTSRAALAPDITLFVPVQYYSSNSASRPRQPGIHRTHSTTGVERMCLRSVLTPLVCYLRHRLTSFKGRLTSSICGALGLSSVGAPPRRMSKASLGVRSRWKSGATVLSLTIRSTFTTHSKRCPAEDVSESHARLANPELRSSSALFKN